MKDNARNIQTIEFITKLLLSNEIDYKKLNVEQLKTIVERIEEKYQK